MQNKARSFALHRQRSRTRLAALALAVTSFGITQLVTLGALSADRNDVRGMEILDASPCADDSAPATC